MINDISLSYCVVRARSGDLDLENFSKTFSMSDDDVAVVQWYVSDSHGEVSNTVPPNELVARASVEVKAALAVMHNFGIVVSESQEFANNIVTLIEVDSKVKAAYVRGKLYSTLSVNVDDA